MKLYIDTRNTQNVIARIDKDGEIYEEVSQGEARRPESILKLIEKACKKASIGVSQIEEIVVEEGPGSYTGIKVGVSVANALSFALHKKVNSQPLGNLIEPKYE